MSTFTKNTKENRLEMGAGYDELSTIMNNALLEMHRLVTERRVEKTEFLSMVNLFLLGILSTAADLAEITSPGASAFIYAEVEAGAKTGGIRAIKKFQTKFSERTYSVSGIDPDDEETAMNYVGQELGTALFKSLHELPKSLRKPEMFLRGIEALLTNVLNNKFSEYDPHRILDSLCEHVHLSLHDLQSRRTISH